MKDAVDSLIEKFAIEITSELRDYLRFLYENLHLEELSDKEQHYFIDYFYKSEALRNMAAFALELADIMQEIQENIPTIEQAERLANGKEQRLYYEHKWEEVRRHKLKHQTRKKGNILYVPFNEYKKDPGPIIICLEQTTGMEAYTELCKSMILPLFMSAHREQRDLYIVPYDYQIHVHYRFENGHLNLSDFKDFMEYKAKGEAAILPVLHFVKGLLQENQHCSEADIIIFTEGRPIDGQHLVGKQTKTMLEEMKKKYYAEFSVIAMHEHNFNEQQFWFANKAIFADDAIQ
ncbi:hypothetical protein [Lysinibacillus pakistanensis]|uniref:DUF1444 family protein n=1 Tax=Lysinibacillus pakistanensis TaxID=759811 RepID=A0AAX3WQ42_9BACI|nr:hypothetical protein [Lysinibacillus pakistanensis]MDM5234375.1 hypothetical protein [Lysinibacillus pakistanensis]WHY44962.1 hypothetical protein QNH22_16780 [Lysinibacillus pakistanensis]WHY49970.1 hypothetical protein QNH24_16745 [Lysinibacillus pakistanensis]